MRIADKLKKLPSVHKRYLRLCVLYDQYIKSIPFKTLLSQHEKNKEKKLILCYPDMPPISYVIRQICELNGFSLTTDIKRAKDADSIVYFEDSTYRKPNKVLRKVKEKYSVVNFYSQDVSKQTVNRLHKKVFGYNLSINPLTYKGSYVRKGNLNGIHNGKIVNQPEKPQKGYVYQRIVNNQVGSEVMDIRVPVIGNNIPFAYIKYRPVQSRFESRNNSAKLAKVSSLLTGIEQKKIIALCRKMKVDQGELDLLRDNDTKKIYVVDVNNTPGGPTWGISLKDYEKGLEMTSKAFLDTFCKNKKQVTH